MSERPSPWHRGEVELQASLGAADMLDKLGRVVIRETLTEQLQKFFPQLPFVVIGSVDPAGNPWATLQTGTPGFITVPDARHLRIAAVRNASDPADAGVQDGAALGLLGIELHTRRRNRVNGIVRRKGPAGFDVEVEQAFGNCPQYIQLRDVSMAAAAPASPIELPALDQRTKDMVRRADTFFVASYVDREQGPRQVDVSHRGGKTGFARVDEDGGLTIPDFSGNRFFMTLGNLSVNPRAGLVFIDFQTGDLLQMTGTTQVLLDSPETARYAGAQRLWRFLPRRVCLRRGALGLRWAFREDGWSPTLASTGTWEPAPGRTSP